MLWNEPEGYIRTPGPPKQSSHILGFWWPGVHFVPLGEALPDAHWVPFPLKCLRTGSAPTLNNPITLLLSTWLKPDRLLLDKNGIFHWAHCQPSFQESEGRNFPL